MHSTSGYSPEGPSERNKDEKLKLKAYHHIKSEILSREPNRPIKNNLVTKSEDWSILTPTTIQNEIK